MLGVVKIEDKYYEITSYFKQEKIFSDDKTIHYFGIKYNGEIFGSYYPYLEAEIYGFITLVNCSLMKNLPQHKYKEGEIRFAIESYYFTDEKILTSEYKTLFKSIRSIIKFNLW